jgi:hypothetical protein
MSEDIEVLENEEEMGEVVTDSRMIPFPDIEQYRNVIKLVRDRCQYEGRPLPTLRFNGTVKLHGTNASVVYRNGDPEIDIQVQSRNGIITPQADTPYRFASYVYSTDGVGSFGVLGNNLRIMHPAVIEPVAVYGEWCGGNIQKNVAINGLPKMFVVFAIRVYRGRDADGHDRRSEWFSKEEIQFALHGTGLQSIYDYPFWEMDIDFARPEIAQDKLGKLTHAVELECPVGKAHGNSGVGEGIVWWAVPTPNFNTHGLVFKVKGEKHSESKVKTLAPVDVEKINNMRELVATILTEHRLEKKLDEFKAQGFEIDIKFTGQFLKLVSVDVNKEEADTIEASGLDRKAVMAMVAQETRQYWMKVINSSVGL